MRYVLVMANVIEGSAKDGKRVAVAAVWLHQAEGTHKAVAEHNVTLVGEDALSEADELVVHWAHKDKAPWASDRAGYYKTDYCVLWADGTTHKGQYSMTRGAEVCLSMQVLRELRYVAKNGNRLVKEEDSLHARSRAIQMLRRLAVYAGAHLNKAPQYREPSNPYTDLDAEVASYSEACSAAIQALRAAHWPPRI